MKGQLSQDTPVGAPASMVWSAYRGLELGRLINQLLGDVLGKTEVVEGDGGVGTIIKLTFPHGMRVVLCVKPLKWKLYFVHI
uniref:Uncharacterized protein n=1 Tax=Rhizophora mucronata TaxID=61149 RepID=A0A2P2IVW8_RHIMU